MTVIIKKIVTKQATQFFAFSLVCLLFISSGPLCALSKKKRAFIAHHRLPKSIEARAQEIFSQKLVQDAVAKGDKALLKNEGFLFLASRGNLIMEHPDLPGWVIKYGRRFSWMFNNIARINMAEEIQAYLDKKHITSVVMPQKKLFHIPGRPKKFRNQNYLVFSEKMNVQPREEPRILSRKTVKETCRVIWHFGLVDASAGNFCLLDNEHVTIVDTEPTSRTGKGLWWVLDNPLSRIVRASAGEYIFRHSVTIKEAPAQTTIAT